eukprot:3791627-Pyramimonas_sp.AAC.2
MPVLSASVFQGLVCFRASVQTRASSSATAIKGLRHGCAGGQGDRQRAEGATDDWARGCGCGGRAASTPHQAKQALPGNSRQHRPGRARDPSGRAAAPDRKGRQRHVRAHLTRASRVSPVQPLTTLDCGDLPTHRDAPPNQMK